MSHKLTSLGAITDPAPLMSSAAAQWEQSHAVPNFSGADDFAADSGQRFAHEPLRDGSDSGSSTGSASDGNRKRAGSESDAAGTDDLSADGTKRRRRGSSLGVNSGSSTSAEKDGTNRNGNNNNDPDAYRRLALARNRAAASKCRQKKRQWVQELQEKATLASQRQEQLQLSISQLRAELAGLRSAMAAHRNCNCVAIQRYCAQLMPATGDEFRR